MTRSTDLIDEVNILRRELEKLELEKRIAELKTEPIIDGDCIGCAGPCSDRIKEWLKAGEGEVARLRFIITREHGEAAKLQEELESTRNMYRSSSDECCGQRKTIGDLRTKIWELERTLPANFWDVVAGRDATIRKQRTTIRELNDENLSLRVTINDMAKKHIWYKNTIEELKDGNIEDLKERYDLDKKDIDRLKHVISARESSIDECEKIGRHNVNVLKEIINGLEAELSARKEDSAALEKVVEIVRDNKIYPYGAINELADLLVDYLDAPEGPPETPIDESDVLKKIRALVDDWSVNKKGGKQSFFILSEIDDMLKSTQHIDETQDIIVTFAFLELP